MDRKLTPQQQSFAAEVAAGNCTLTEAALRAGYSPKSASKLGSQLMANPRISAEVDRIRAKAAATAQGSRVEVLDIIYETLHEARVDGDRANTLKAAELWLKATGNLVEKRENVTEGKIELEWPAPLDLGDVDEMEAADAN